MQSYKLQKERFNMVVNQLYPQDINSAKILSAFTSVPRDEFVPEKLKNIAYTDRQIELKEGRYLASPMILAKMIDYANLDDNNHVLVIGANSGYFVALISKLVKSIIAIESDYELLSKLNCSLKELSIKNVIAIEKTLSLGHSEGAPYDVIFIDGAVKSIPKKLILQLKDGGKIVSAINKNSYNGVLTVFSKNNDKLSAKEICFANLEPLPNFDNI